MAFTERGAAFHGCPDEKQQIHLVLSCFLLPVIIFTHIEKHKLCVTVYTIVLAMTFAGYFISFTRRATDFLEQKVLQNEVSVTYATGQTIPMYKCGWLCNIALEKTGQHIIRSPLEGPERLSLLFQLDMSTVCYNFREIHVPLKFSYLECGLQPFLY